jgi:CPA2 family monovalent cation:H+ antiporter-2
MFTIGLELSFPKLFSMRRALLGLGGLQVTICSIICIAIAKWCGLSWVAATTIAGALSLSSTAVVTKMLLERDALHTTPGRLSLSILLFQDLAAVVFLILIPAMSSKESAVNFDYEFLKEFATGMFMFLMMLIVGRFGLRPIFDAITQSKSSELFMMTILLVILGSAFFTFQIGLSLALGSFIAGVMLAETKYVHQIEADIEPFRDILLGLFFIAVGLTMNVQEALQGWGWILTILAALIVGKVLIISMLTRFSRCSRNEAWQVGIKLAQGGEFGLALLFIAKEKAVIDPFTNQILLSVIVLSMAIAPVMIRKAKDWAQAITKEQPSEEDSLPNQNSFSDHVVICGYGRVGQIQAKFLEYEGIKYVGLDLDTRLIKEARIAGEPVFYGDASDKSILHTTRIKEARLAIITIDQPSKALKVLRAIRSLNRDIPILIRTQDDHDMEKLKLAGATEVIPDQLESSLMLATHMLILLGQKAEKAQNHIWEFKTTRYQMLQGYYHGNAMGHIETTQEDNNHLHAVNITDTAFAQGKTIEEVIGDLEVELQSFTRSQIKSAFPAVDTILLPGDTVVLKGSMDNIYLAEERLLQG